MAELALTEPVVVPGEELHAECDDCGVIRMWAGAQATYITVPPEASIDAFFDELAAAIARRSLLKRLRAA